MAQDPIECTGYSDSEKTTEGGLTMLLSLAEGFEFAVYIESMKTSIVSSWV